MLFRVDRQLLMNTRRNRPEVVPTCETGTPRWLELEFRPGSGFCCVISIAQTTVLARSGAHAVAT
jgi:hypothetical protein